MNVEDRIKVDGRFSKDDVLLDRYRIVQLIGEGGFADVYEAADMRDGRQVALKILHQVDGNKRQQTIRRRFILEAELVAQIKHPDVVELFDFGVTGDGRLFISLELLHGQTLEDALYRQGAMEPARALRLVSRCLEAVQSAHELGVVHRDLKPSNLFLDQTEDGTERLRVLDFGIAFMTDEVDNRMTRTGQINGTPQYLAPEYIQQQIVTKALDVYQLALILVEMCTGVQVVHDDNPYKCLMAHVSGKLDLPDQLMETELGPVLRTALCSDHEKRYADAAAFRAALLPFLGNSDALQVYESDEDRQTAGARRKHWKSGHELPVHIEVKSSDGPQSAAILDRQAQLEDTHSQLIAKPTPASSGGRNKLIAVVAGVTLIVAAGTYFGISRLLGDTGESLTVAAVADVGVDGALVAPAADVPDAAVEGEPSTEDAAGETSEPAANAPEEMEFSADSVGVAVDIVATPPSAEIFRGADTIGIGTATIVFDTAEDEPIELRVSGSGYETKLAKVAPADSPKITIALKRAKRTNIRPKKKKVVTKKQLKFFD